MDSEAGDDEEERRENDVEAWDGDPIVVHPTEPLSIDSKPIPSLFISHQSLQILILPRASSRSDAARISS